MFGEDNRMALEAPPAGATPAPQRVPLDPWEEPEDLAYGEPRLRDAS
jgi:hypothetical protein